MAKIPVRCKRVTAAFDEIARARLCESSGSEHSAADNSEELSELLDSFFETDDRVEDEEEKKKREEEKSCSESESYCTELETKEALISLTGGGEDGRMKQMICAETELACRSMGSGSSEGFKRRVMSWLRQRGFDAGLCKSRWEKSTRHPAGEYEYIDIIIAGTRYIVELSPANEFTVARPTNHYTSLLEALSPVLICKEDELKQVLRLICAAMRESLKKRELHVPPWRRNEYMQAKCPCRSLVGFEASPAIHSRCRGEVARKAGLHVGNLNAALSGMHL
ncbi:hypothetical protein F0562_011195 [Nyssa sinensis]|uniref:DUF506 domain-containing protein n=1 Tax=Nyssa sinensis TaxID=561372 RepID=A0A5J5A4K4_9ASTE|nr:hypothetical protein F0562_011195 [Nyssa sinensis]